MQAGRGRESLGIRLGEVGRETGEQFLCDLEGLDVWRGFTQSEDGL